MGYLEKITEVGEEKKKYDVNMCLVKDSFYLFSNVESLAVGFLVEPHAAERFSNNGVVRLL